MHIYHYTKSQKYVIIQVQIKRKEVIVMLDLNQRVLQALNSLTTDEPGMSELAPIVNRLGGELQYGATRWAIVFPKQRTVYKFARLCSVQTDYCELELKNYNLAKEYGVERCLLPIEFIGEITCGLRIYRQPMYLYSLQEMPNAHRRTMTAKYDKTMKWSMVTRIRRGCHDAPHDQWIARATQIYGKSFMRSFQKWTHEARVNDLHTSNIGFLGKQPIIIDYAGYHG